jgi:hypothetical protein
LLISVPVGSAAADGVSDVGASAGVSAVLSVAPPVGVSAPAEELLLSEICASSGVGEDTAEPSWLPLVPLLTVGASGVTEEEASATTAAASGASVVAGADGVSIVVATGGTTAVRSGAVSCGGGAASVRPAPLAAIEPPRPPLNQRRGCDWLVVCGAFVTDQPSSVVAVDDVAGAVSVGAAVSAGGASFDSSAPDSVGIVGIVPIESS